MPGLRDVLRKTGNISEACCGLLGLTLLAICLFQIFMRVAFGKPVIWVFELSSVIVVYTIFLGGVVITVKDQAATVSLLVDRLPPTLQWLVSNAVALLVSAMGGALLYSIWTYGHLQGTYMMSNIPLGVEVLTYPVYVFGIILVCKGLVSLRRLDR